MTVAAFDGQAVDGISFEIEDNDERSITNFFRSLNSRTGGSVRSR